MQVTRTISGACMVRGKCVMPPLDLWESPRPVVERGGARANSLARLPSARQAGPGSICKPSRGNGWKIMSDNASHYGSPHLGDLVKGHQEEEHREVHEGSMEEASCGSCRAGDHERNPTREERDPECEGPKEIDGSRQPYSFGQKAHDEQRRAVTHDRPPDVPPLWVDDRKGPEAPLGIVVPIQPGDGQGMGDLPQKQDREEDPGLDRKLPPRRCPNRSPAAGLQGSLRRGC